MMVLWIRILYRLLIMDILSHDSIHGYLYYLDYIANYDHDNLARLP